MLGRLARGLFLVAMVAMIVAYAVALANPTPPPPMDPNDFVVQWC